MARIGRPGPSDGQRQELLQRWKAGESLSEIGRALKAPGLHSWRNRPPGGVVPAERTRSCRAITLDEREEISRELATDDSICAIARALQRNPSSISREVARNGGRLRYRAVDADEQAWSRSRRPKRCRLAESDALCALVAEKLEADWSPEQVAGWLKDAFPDDETMHVSHVTIYRRLFIQARGVLKKGVDCASAGTPTDATQQARLDDGADARADRGRRVNCRSSSGRGGSGDPGPLGR